MHTFLLNNVSPSLVFSSQKQSKATKLSRHQIRCKASSNSNSSTKSSSWVMDYDLYELLGVERSSGQAEIKAAYRALQKHCHPDIAGPAGHDMAIVLNEVYSLLMDPASRSIYDQEQAKLSEFQGYTGKPLYSVWSGPETEQRAVFVDELKCVGCLKCALFANKTFAIESCYGRARVVSQWADPEEKIFEAIQTCPVDCISMVERSNLAALEFLMSKQPRGSVRISQGNTVGARVSNIFADLNKFQTRFYEMKQKASKRGSEESEFQRGSRISAVQGIRSISNWWYWQPFKPETSREDASLTSNPTHRRSKRPFTQKLLEAATRRKEQGGIPARIELNYSDKYWNPVHILPSPSINRKAPTAASSESPINVSSEQRSSKYAKGADTKKIRLDIRTPSIMAILAASLVMYQGDKNAGIGVEQHMGGEIAMQIVNSFEMQVLLSGATWFMIGLAVVGLVEVLEMKSRKAK
ncbi:Chaperone protein DnaJ [Rhynchospora pubera]|uniref:Chaperone protein DnaJ n=1 Tax=Rhynchospora pubera TaxID=906938 RepID=A0AAV8EJE3_9POAL|nr:Chaperone protein DnaJ [Rhynchospora pubera]